MDATTIGAMLALIGVLSGSVVAYLGKRGENANARLNSEMDQIQEERNRMDERLAARDQKIEVLLEQRVTDQVEIARLRVKIVELGGDPS
ncbi:hypothetical protein QBA57_39595 [Streptomyces scabiei]|uniref:hypothetical protein n=1 Tax=Streptomyces scabiei TaxID=1930 RepID=UPI0029AC45FB|nr:hypothetical protein [Streptomyces scabiei]MDX2566100.1 hypothetical protein [Streptomyces scabiei]MDX3153138.1 hypothetical protein [Streptomyces scabiei]MDX3162121.1 hypothetical protein [Streptomyces scabiei]MDX3288140.1 hypothetical protein [Streptomyces scabiei]